MVRRKSLVLLTISVLTVIVIIVALYIFRENGDDYSGKMVVKHDENVGTVREDAFTSGGEVKTTQEQTTGKHETTSGEKKNTAKVNCNQNKDVNNKAVINEKKKKYSDGEKETVTSTESSQSSNRKRETVEEKYNGENNGKENGWTDFY